MRIRTDLTEEDRERVEKYAHENGLRMPRAYAELVREGLDAGEDDS